MTVVIAKAPPWGKIDLEALCLDSWEKDLMGKCIAISLQCYTGYIGEKLACVWGLIPPTLLSTHAYLWLYTAAFMKEHPFLLVRHSQRVVEVMLQDYPTIVGHCHIRDSKAIRWMKWLGATFGNPDGLRVPFTIRKK